MATKEKNKKVSEKKDVKSSVKDVEHNADIEKSNKKEKQVNKTPNANDKKNVKKKFSIKKWFKEVFGEFKKVRWPNKKEMIKYSIATIVFILFFALFFYLIEVAIYLINQII